MVVALGLVGAAPARAVDFAKEVHPVLQKHCIGCHGGARPKGGLRLDLKAAAMKGGVSGPVIVPGKSAASELIERVTSAENDARMPPKGEPLTKEQVAILRQWIDEGAPWPASADSPAVATETHWSLKPLRKESPPASGHPLDAFLDARLREKGLTVSPAEDRRTLIRRLTFDLTGLPPTPEEVKKFVDDNDPAAYERLVDRLLASPRYGEHWARHWLDVVHYADTHGNDHDYYRPNAWPYRDYVIRSFNDDKPYARFVQEQVAGDALFPADPQATVALGFLAAGPWDHTLLSTIREDTADHRMGRNLDRDNIVSTVMSTFTSLTVHCARCHNHKFDPLSQREYYALQAVFAGIDRADRPVDLDPKVGARRKDLLARKSALAAKNVSYLEPLDSPEMSAKIAALAKTFAERKDRWQPLDVDKIVSAKAGGGTVFTRQEDASWFVSGVRPEKDTFVITANTKLSGVRALRLEVLPDKRLPVGGPGRYDNGNFHLSRFLASARRIGEDKGEVPLVFTRALADHADAGDAVAGAIDDNPNTYWSIHPKYNEPHEAVFALKDPITFAAATLTIQLEFNGKPGHQIGRFRLWASTEAPTAIEKSQAGPTIPPPIAAILAADKHTPEQRRELALYVLATEVERELAALPPQQLVYAATRDFAPAGSFKPSSKPRPIHLLARGDINKPGELMGPAATACVPDLPATLAIANLDDESLRRAALARWLTDDRNVLTWRSIVNRVWHYHFGRGLCDSPNDFGKMGGTPSHPELLDWLTVWFHGEAKGSFKALHRLIVTSAAYKRTSAPAKGAGAIDSDNRLLGRMNRMRLTGEMVRDATLQMSGRIDWKMGGPSVVQFKHKGVAATFMPADGSPAFLDYEKFDPDAPESSRRAIYRFVFRTVPDPLMDALDCPDGGAMVPVRSASTTALQALAMLNNSFLVRQCEHIAARIARETKEPADQAAAAFHLMLQRPPTQREVVAFAAYIQRHGLANACHVLLNSNEFLYVD